MTVYHETADKKSNVSYSHDTKEGVMLYHFDCEKEFNYKYLQHVTKEKTTECPHCNGDIVFPNNVDW